MAGTIIPHEIMVEILSRLPAKSLLRFRCVCKPWCNLITSDSSFSKLHLSRATERDDEPILLATKSSWFTNEISGKGVDLKFLQTYIYCVDGNSMLTFKDPLGSESFGCCSKLWGSCNGVLCLVRNSQVCLVNPYTREFKTVKFEEEFCFSGNAIYAFGYDTNNEDYKLVRCVETEDCESEIKVHSLADASCLIMSNVPYRIKKPGIFLNGALHWVAKHKDKFLELVISFNIGEEVVQEIPLSESMGLHDVNLDLGMIGGQLAMFKSNYTNMLEIWVMKHYGAEGSWCKLLSIKGEDMYPIINPWPIFLARTKLRPLYFSKNGDVLINDGRNLVIYDLKKKTTRNLDIHGISDPFEMERIVTHVASLVPLKSGTYAGTIVGVEEEDQAH